MAKFFNYLIIMLFAVQLQFAMGCKTASEKDIKTEKDSSTKYETEAEEESRLLIEKQAEEEKTYNELNLYDGKYSIYSESEGVVATLEVKYNNDKTFNFTWDFYVTDICSAKYEGMIQMDRTQHGFFNENGCTLHFNFMGSWPEGEVIEIEIEGDCDKLLGDCEFNGKYIKNSSN